MSRGELPIRPEVSRCARNPNELSVNDRLVQESGFLSAPGAVLAQPRSAATARHDASRILHARLTPNEELDLIAAAEAGDRDACRQLVQAFLPAIAAVARHFRIGSGVDRQELVQEGVAGLLLAARRYDPRLETRFWTYASFWVRKAMQELVAELSRPVVLSDRAVRGLAEIHAAQREHLRVHGAEPTNRELSAATGLSLPQVERLRATERATRSVEELLEGIGGSSATVGDTIVDPLAEMAFEEVLDGIEVRQFQDLADRLETRERDVIRAHYGLGRPAQTLDQIGGSLGLTAERARQIEFGALEKLRAALSRPAVGRRT
jgi:RNA polymerase primary sigma factor